MLVTPAPKVQTPAASTKSVIATLEEMGNCTLFVSALKAADLDETLGTTTKYTAFVPSDEAFRSLPPDDLLELMRPDSKDKLIALIKAHLAKAELDRSTLKTRGAYSAETGQRFAVTFVNDRMVVERSKVAGQPTACTNGLIYVMDSVLAPPSQDVLAVMRAHGCGEFAKLVEQSDFKSMLGKDWQFTFFAPTDDAIKKLPAGTIERLMTKDGSSALWTFVKSHVYFGRLYTAGMEDGKSIKTTAGPERPVKSDDVKSGEGTFEWPDGR
ncbi:MAG TPA: fasciclin domain-containing protein, partial [Phycisphaerales bacterium]|nr:fasciclin domain-containing protein [Phycisphaerales bacterium]